MIKSGARFFYETKRGERGNFVKSVSSNAKFHGKDTDGFYHSKFNPLYSTSCLDDRFAVDILQYQQEMIIQRWCARWSSN